MRSLLLLTLILTLVSCKQDPYPSEGKLQTDRVQAPRVVDPPLSMAVDDVIEYHEGRQLQYGIRVAVKEPGIPEVTIDNLPAGAEFDPKRLILTWKPSFFDGNNPKDPSIKSRIYPITVWLRSSLDREQALKKQVSLVVHDVPREIKIDGSNSVSVNENSKLSYTFEINNADYPQGPYKVVTSGMPANAKLVKVNENKYKVEFTPDYYHVNLPTDGSNKKYTGKIIVANPANHTETKEVDISVNDKRLSSKLVTPDTLTQGLDVSFQVAAYDLNKEVTPRIELLSDTPDFGRFTTKLVKNEENKSSVLNVFWNDIPPVHNGKTLTLRFKSCVLSSQWSYGNCENDTTDIKVVVRERKPPTIDRSSMPVGEMLYLGFNEKLSKYVYVKDAEDSQLKPKVEILPKEMRKYVSWSNNRLTMQFDKSGTHQFNLVATSDYQVSSSQSFIVEVFPENRSKILFFADTTRDSEARFYKDVMKNVDIMNPFIQDINLRNISDRETLVLGTSILLDKEANFAIEQAMTKIKNIVVASPLIDNMPEKFLDELRQDYNLDFVGRYNDLPRTPNINKVKFAFTRQFRTPSKDVTLNLNTTTESSNPLIFNGGLDDPTKICKGVLGLTETGNNPYVIGVVCKRNNGGKITMLGTEWADLRVDQADANIPQKWFNKMLNGNFH